MTTHTALADETQAAECNVEHKQGVYCNANAIPNHT
jgi:hypothetical protein